ncbi:MAG TPA: hypothetical protein PK836_09320 [Syntrophales bacterium]|nr:hypothetical protein [Syntrophales bacterium]HOM07836.1 hypothetical protein [Syntrophales bacterium]HOO00530.1 hypothetical protein [Syntrophales bacterium]HPC01864.1 hypothetical protein [Syntrophales bacterium]HPQ07340.1 hypothetical protein [Syntrophales bacterium]
MTAFELNQEEARQLLEVLERYYPALRIEIANTDDREFRRALKVREAFMKEMITRLKERLK